MLTNAKQELIEHVGDRKVDFVSVAFKRYGEPLVQIKGELDEVLPLLDFEYENGYGGQELFGFIWYADGTWSDRGEYDGQGWWQYQACPDRDIDVYTQH